MQKFNSKSPVHSWWKGILKFGNFIVGQRLRIYLLASHPTSENISRQMFPHERLVRMFVMKKVLVTLTLNLIGSSSMGKINKYNSLYVAGYYTAKN